MKRSTKHNTCATMTTKFSQKNPHAWWDTARCAALTASATSCTVLHACCRRQELLEACSAISARHSAETLFLFLSLTHTHTHEHFSLRSSATSRPQYGKSEQLQHKLIKGVCFTIAVHHSAVEDTAHRESWRNGQSKHETEEASHGRPFSFWAWRPCIVICQP